MIIDQISALRNYHIIYVTSSITNYDCVLKKL